MKKILLVLGGALLLQSAVSAQTQATGNPPHPPRCGLQQFKAAMIAKDPTWVEKFAAQKAGMQDIANKYIAMKQSGELERTSSTISAVPIVFHIIVDSAQFNALGGTLGIMNRCDSQIAVLNRDYNRENKDSTSIPSSWKSLYGTPGIHFGLARIDPSGNCSPGYEVKIISGTNLDDAGFDNECDAFPEAKTASTGLAAWDVTKYYNVWCINFTNDPGGDPCLQASGLLGLTQPKSFVSGSTIDQEGVCMLYNVLGCTAADGTPPPNTGGSAGWFYPYNLGRTLTHETGHFFEIWHPWGDDGPDNGLGYCPWSYPTCDDMNSTLGSDDGLSDTPPESQAVYGNPTYTITGGTYNDCCQNHGTTNTQPIGIACLSYMDYTDDDAMHMFTSMQAAAMASMVLVPPASGTGATGSGTIGENYNLTQNPSLLVCDTGHVTSSVQNTQINNSLNIFPNPTTGQVTITLNSSAENLNQIIVINLLGQEVMTVSGQNNKDFYTLDLSGMSKGIYFIQCNFASGSTTRKVLLQ